MTSSAGHARRSVCAISEGPKHALRLHINPSRPDLQVPLMTLNVRSKRPQSLACGIVTRDTSETLTSARPVYITLPVS